MSKDFSHICKENLTKYPGVISLPLYRFGNNSYSIMACYMEIEWDYNVEKCGVREMWVRILHTIHEGYLLIDGICIWRVVSSGVL